MATAFCNWSTRLPQPINKLVKDRQLSPIIYHSFPPLVATHSASLYISFDPNTRLPVSAISPWILIERSPRFDTEYMAHQVHEQAIPRNLLSASRSESYVLVFRSNAASHLDTITTDPTHVHWFIEFKSLPRSYGKRCSGTETVLNTFFLDCYRKHYLELLRSSVSK